MNQEQKVASLEEARQVLRTARTAALSVLDFETGGPLTAFVNHTVTEAFEPLVLVSLLSRHTRCLDRDGRGSILVTGTIPAEGDALTGFRASLTGRFVRDASDAVRARYLSAHPYAEIYSGFGDFGFFRMTPERLYVVAGFGRVHDYNATLLMAST